MSQAERDVHRIKTNVPLHQCPSTHATNRPVKDIKSSQVK